MKTKIQTDDFKKQDELEEKIGIDQILEMVKIFGKMIQSDYIMAFKNYRIEYHHSHRAIVVETREAETIEINEEEA